MESGQLQRGTAAPYGRACINCSRAKSKCILLASASGCERCQRLRKECRPSPSMRKRNGRPSASKTAQLEAKLDHLASLLQAGGTPAGPPTAQNCSSEHASPCQGGADTYTSTALPSPPTTAASPGDCSLQDVCSALPISPETAEKTLTQFRTQNLKILPVVHIPPHVTSQQLRQEKPFLWLCIMAVLTPGNIQREALFGKITSLVQQKLLSEVAPSMDMLLGLMTFISWTTYSRRPFLNFYAHLIMGLVCDLGINQALPREYSTMQAFKSAMGWRQQIPTVRTTEERRAVLGCFLITSCIALTMFRIDALRWNPHMEESLSVLAEAKECPEDELLVSLVKIQLVMDKVYHLRRDGDNKRPTAFYTKAFQSQLDSVKDQIPQYLKQDKAILLYLANAELTIHEAAIQTPSLPNSPEMHCLESLYTSLQASKSWLDIWLSIPPEQYMGISFTMFFQFCRALVNLYKLSTLDDPAWDRNMVRNTANILEILDRTHYMMRKSAEYLAVPNDPEWNVFEKGVRMVKSIKQNWEPKLREMWFPSMSSNGMESEFVQSGPLLPDLMSMTGFDDSWMLDVFGSM